MVGLEANSAEQKRSEGSSSTSVVLVRWTSVASRRWGCVPVHPNRRMRGDISKLYADEQNGRLIHAILTPRWVANGAAGKPVEYFYPKQANNMTTTVGISIYTSAWIFWHRIKFSTTVQSTRACRSKHESNPESLSSTSRRCLVGFDFLEA